MFLANRWYAAALGAEIGAVPSRARSAGASRVAPHRGGALRLEDRCAHRHAPLSLGTVKGEAIQWLSRFPLRCRGRVRPHTGAGGDPAARQGRGPPRARRMAGLGDR
jgi:hypothetical protein